MEGSNPAGKAVDARMRDDFIRSVSTGLQNHGGLMSRGESHWRFISEEDNQHQKIQHRMMDSAAARHSGQ